LGTISQLQIKFFSKWEEYFAQPTVGASKRVAKLAKKGQIACFLKPRLKGFLGALCGFA
jgi:hypothetical protein